jgi:hypothetical protein
MLALQGARQQLELYGSVDASSLPLVNYGKKRAFCGQGSGDGGALMPWQQALPSAKDESAGTRKACGERTAVRYRGAPGEVSRQQIEVPCLGAVPGEERSVQLPDGRECLVRVPSDVTGDRFLLQWVPILPPARKRRCTVEPPVAATDTKKTWKHADALIAARPSSALATSELLRLRAPALPRTRIFAPSADQLPVHDASDTWLGQWAPVNSSDLGETKLDAHYEYDDALDYPETSSTVFSATPSTDLFGISDFLL